MEKKKVVNALRIGTYSLSALSGVYVVTNLSLKGSANKNAQKNDGSPDNTIGYDEINILTNELVRTNNFVILHVKRDDDIVGLREKIEFCQNNNISIGLVLDTEASNLATIYKDVDFLQAIVKEYKIDFPIYCNIESIMSNSTLNVAQRREIIDAFIDKMSRSDMYFGFYGKDSSLCECKEHVLDTTLYDCFLVKEKETVDYAGTYILKKDIDGKITSSSDLSKVILERGFNSSHKLVYSATYKVKENDTYHSVALSFGLSEQDLREYNESTKGELEVGQTITIPNLYKTVNTDTNEVTYNYAIARGIDISDYQTNINWDRVKETSDFVIVEVARDPSNYEVNRGSYIDECANQIKNIVENDIELGLYFCISNDMKISVYEERLEEYLTKLEDDLEINNIILERENIPVFLDFEVYYEHNDYYRLMEMFEKLCNAHGFTKIGIYGNGSTLSSISSSLNKDGQHIELKNTNWYVWKSGGSQYSSNENYDEGLTLEEIQEPKNESNNQYTPAILQATNVCKDAGAGNHVGNCDVNFCYTDLFGNDANEEQYEALQYVPVNLDKYTNVSVKNIVNAIANTLIAVGVIVATIEIVGRNLIIGVKKKQKQKRL